MKAALLIWLVFAGRVTAAEPTRAPRHAGQEPVFHYGLMPATIVLAHSDKRAGSNMQGSEPSKETGVSGKLAAEFEPGTGSRRATSP